MPIPERLAFKEPSDVEVREYREICNEIGKRVLEGEDTSALLARWNARASRVYSPDEFTTFRGAIDVDEFVSLALIPRPTFVEDLTYDELRAVFESVTNATFGSEAAHSYFLEWLEVQLPDAEVSELLYWPDQWFRVPEALHFDFSADQLIRAAMDRSGRVLESAPVVSLPYDVPPRQRVRVTPAR